MASPNFSSSNMPWTWTQPSTSADHVQWTWSQPSTPVDHVPSTWSQSSVTVDHTAKADNEVNYMAQNNEIWDFLDIPIPTQTLIEPPVKMVKLGIGSESLCLDDLLTPLTPTMANNSTYLDILSQLEKDLSLPHPTISSVKQVPHTPIKEDSNIPVQKDLLSYAIDFIGINENDVNDIPHTAPTSNDLLSIAIDSIGENDVAIPETGTGNDLLALAIDSVGINGVNSLYETEPTSIPTAPRKYSLTSSMNHVMHSPSRKRARSPTRALLHPPQKLPKYPATRKVQQYTVVQKSKKSPDVQKPKKYPAVQKPKQYPGTQKLQQCPSVQKVQHHPAVQKMQQHPSVHNTQQYPTVQELKQYTAVQKSKQYPGAQKLQQHPSVQKAQQHPSIQKVQHQPAVLKPKQHPSLQNMQHHPVAQKSKQYPAVQKLQQHPSVQNVQQHSAVQKLKQHPSYQKVQQHPAIQKPKQYPTIQKVQQYPGVSLLQQSLIEPKVKKNKTKKELYPTDKQPYSSAQKKQHLPAAQNLLMDFLHFPPKAPQPPVQQGNGTLTCPWCRNDGFQTPDALSTHLAQGDCILDYLPMSRGFQCVLCKQFLSEKNDVFIHAREHRRGQFPGTVISI